MTGFVTQDGNIVVRLEARTGNLDVGLKALADVIRRKPTIAPLMSEYFDRQDTTPFITWTEHDRGKFCVVVTPSDEFWDFLIGAGASPDDIIAIRNAFGVGA